ncbi:hypothetical protein, partial [Paenibacillus lactis]|uniref:hypothetical protein n=1 Tax=Paenibacillus lactis TaxID=228574 RepID=UPI0036CD9132
GCQLAICSVVATKITAHFSRILFTPLDGTIPHGMIMVGCWTIKLSFHNSGGDTVWRAGSDFY